MVLDDGYKLKLGIAFDKEGILGLFLIEDEKTEPLPLDKWVGLFAPELAPFVPSQLPLSPEWAFVFLAKSSEQQKGGAIGLSLKLDFQFSQLPFELPFELPDFGIKAFQLFWTWGKGPAKALQAKTHNYPSISNAVQQWIGNNTQLPEGCTIRLETTGWLNQLPALTTDFEPTEPEPETSAATKPTSKIAFKDNSAWLAIDKTIGPITIGKAGVRWRLKEMSADLMLDITAKIGPLQAALMGFGVRLTLKDGLQTELMLEGIGLAMQWGGVALQGVLLRTMETDPDGAQRPEYNGLITVKIGKIMIGGLAAYTQLQGQASFMAYAGIRFSPGFPLGVLPITFTGIALGVGVNRQLVMPTIDKVTEFPLVKLAMGKPAGDLNLADSVSIVRSLSQTFVPKLGHQFLAIGLQFEVAKLVDCFALAVLKFGEGFEFHLLGAIRLIFPEGNDLPTMLRIELAFIASLDLGEGTFKLDAALSPKSFLFAEECRLTGELSLYTWFKGSEAGDFVLSLGGYHPRFTIPAHYPRPQKRLGFEVRYDEILISGGVYFALTPKAIMAGGYLSLSFQTKIISAGLEVGFDMLLAWEPFAYDIELRVKIWVKLWITAHLSVELRIYGPPFSGMLRTRIFGILLEIHFGEDQPAKKDPIDWPRFRDVYLEKALLNLNPTAGVLGEKKMPNGQRKWVMHPETVQWELATLLPVTALNGQAENNAAFGIAPMNVPSEKVRSNLTIELWRENQRITHLKLIPQPTNGPAALWGNEFEPGFSSPTLVEGLITSYQIIPEKEAEIPWQVISARETEILPTLAEIRGLQMEPEKATVEHRAMDWIDQFHAVYG